jgi:hypothetical protein
VTEVDEERRAIRDAMTRLLDGRPIRSDGKLTIKSLAAEADVKRWALTHKHQDLQGEFRDRVAQNGSDPEPVRLLKQHIEKLTQTNQDLRTELREAKAACSMLERLIAVEALETHGADRPVPPPERVRLHTV